MRGKKIGGAYGCGDPGVQDIVAHLLGQVHGVSRNDHGIGPQDGIIGDDELGAVLHIEQDPVPLFYTASFLQVTGQGFHLVVKPLISHAGSVIGEGPLVGISSGRNFQVVIQRGLRDGYFMRNAFGPKTVM
jgi:hypothetical protein